MYKRSILLIIIIVVLSISSGCGSMYTNVNDLSFKYGVIETTGQENISYFSFYDDGLKKIGEKQIKYGSMGDGFLLPIVYKNSMYIVPKGIYNRKELTFIMEYDLDKMKIEKHDTGLQNMNSIAVDDDSVYGVNTMNFISNIVKCSKETKKLQKVEIPDTYISYIEVYGDKLFAFGESAKEGKMETFLYILNANSLDVLEKIDISNIGFGQYSTTMKDNRLYFSSSYSAEGIESQPIGLLSEYSNVNGEIRTYDLKEGFPFQIMEYGDKLLITHFDPVGVVGNMVSIFNTNDGSSEIIELEHNVEQLGFDGEDIIILGEGQLYRYDKEFKLKDSTLVANDRKTDYHYYTTGFFMRYEQ